MFSRAHPRPKCSAEAYVGPPGALRGHPEWTLRTTRREGATGALAFGSLEGGFTLMSGQGPLQWSACGGVTPADRGPPGKKGEGPWTSSPEAPRGQCPRGQQSTDADRMPRTGQRYSENSIHADRSSLFHGRIGPGGKGRPAARGHAPSKWQSQDPDLGRAIDDLSPGRPFHAQRQNRHPDETENHIHTPNTFSPNQTTEGESQGRTDAQGDQGMEPQSRNGGSVPRKTGPLPPPGLGDTSTARGPA